MNIFKVARKLIDRERERESKTRYLTTRNLVVIFNINISATVIKRMNELMRQYFGNVFIFIGSIVAQENL